MRDYYKEKIRNLITLRSNLFTCIIILIGGIVGLFLTNSNLSLIITLTVLGGYFVFTFLVNMVLIHKEINLTLEDLKNECK